MFKFIMNFIMGGNRHYVKAVTIADSSLERLESELTSEFLSAQYTAILHQKINSVNKLWRAFDALSEPTADDLLSLERNIAQIVEIKTDDLAILTSSKMLYV